LHSFYDCLRNRFTKSDGIVKNQFQASNLLSQLGNFANFIAYAFMGIPAGLMLKKLVIKKLLLLQFW
jgi:fucose permease